MLKRLCGSWLLAVVAFALVTGCASIPGPIPRMDAAKRTYDAGFDKAWEAVNDVVAEKRLPIKTLEKESGLLATDVVSSGSRHVFYGRTENGRQLSEWADKTRYFLNIRVRRLNDSQTQIDVLAHMEFMRYEYNAALNRSVAVGWDACESHGDIERELYEAIAKKLGTR